jgi:hypothetical protein
VIQFSFNTVHRFHTAIINPLKRNVTTYTTRLTVTNSAFCMYGFRMIITVNSDKKLKLVMVKCDVLFEVRAEYLNII